jgi:WD40 repeat protein
MLLNTGSFAKMGQRLVGTRFHGKGAFLAVFSPKAKYLATAGGDDTVRVWNGLYEQLVCEFGFEGPISRLTFSSDERYLAVASQENTARLFYVPSGLEIGRVAAGRIVLGVSFESVANANPVVIRAASADGRLVRASFQNEPPAGGDALQKWINNEDKPDTSQSEFQIDRGTGSLRRNRKVFLPSMPQNWPLWWAANNRQIAVGYHDNLARIYDLRSHRMLNVIPVRPGTDDGYLAGDGTLYTRIFAEKLYQSHPAEIRDVVKQVCASLSHRDLTSEEWRASFGWVPQWFKTCPSLPAGER